MLTKNKIIFAGVFLVLGAAIMLASLRGEPEHSRSFTYDSAKSRLVQPTQLADWVIQGRRDFSIIDMREPDAFRAGHVRGAVNCGSCHASKDEGAAEMHGDGFVDLSKKLVLYTETGTEPVELPKILRDNSRIYRLEGGWQGWQRDVLTPVSFDDLIDEEEILAAQKSAAVRGFFTGERATVQRVAKLPVAPIKRRNAHKIAIADEGC